MVNKRKAVNGKGPGRRPKPVNQRRRAQAVTLTASEQEAVRDEIEIRVRQGEIRMTESEMSRHLIRIGLALIAYSRISSLGKQVLDVMNEDIASQESLSK